MSNISIHNDVILLDDSNASVHRVMILAWVLLAHIHRHTLIKIPMHVLGLAHMAALDLPVFNLNLRIVENVVVVVYILYYLYVSVLVLLLRLWRPASALVDSVEARTMVLKSSVSHYPTTLLLPLEVIRMRSWVVLHTLMALVPGQVSVSVWETLRLGWISWLVSRVTCAWLLRNCSSFGRNYFFCHRIWVTLVLLENNFTRVVDVIILDALSL